MDRNEVWARFKNTGSIFDYLEYKNQNSRDYNRMESGEQTGEMRYGTIDKRDWNDTYSSANW